MNSAENVSLKPCPFCGGTAVRIVHVNSRSDIFCETCKTSGPSIWHGGPNADRLTLNRCDSEAIAAWNLRSPPTDDADRVEPVAWEPGTIDRLQRAIMDDDEAVRERAAENVAVLYAHSVAPYAAALAMVREAIGELFGPKASIESEDATLLRGPEPHHEAEAQIAALRRVSASPRPETAGVTQEAGFLIDRLDDFENGSLGDTIEDACRDFDGHVSPAIERLRAALSCLTERSEP